MHTLNRKDEHIIIQITNFTNYANYTNYTNYTNQADQRDLNKRRKIETNMENYKIPIMKWVCWCVIYKYTINNYFYFYMYKFFVIRYTDLNSIESKSKILTDIGIVLDINLNVYQN